MTTTRYTIGRYVWREVREVVGGIPCTFLDPEWRENEAPKCARCCDYGECIGEDGDVETCPDCHGEIEVER